MSIRATIFLTAMVATLLLGGAALADENEPATTNAPPPAAEGTNAGDAGLAAALPAKLQIHGYLTQAYARADQHQVIGITKEGTAEYRMAAIQFRYAMTASDAFVLQLAHEQAGESPIQEEEIELDWGFYERRFGANTRIKVGRVQIPYGIYNEIRDVGTVLPFFRLPINYYGEAVEEVETLDGAVVAHRFAADSPWSVEASAFYGGYETLHMHEGYEEVDMTDALGGQLWLSTPVDGLRLGAGFMRGTASNREAEEEEHEQSETAVYGALDATIDRFVVRGEYRHTDIEGGTTEKAMYAQLGFHVTPKWLVTVQADRHQIHAPATPLAPRVDATTGRDVALGVNYFFRPDLVVKFETHRNRTVDIEDEIPSLANLVRADYVIVSLAVSF